MEECEAVTQKYAERTEYDIGINVIVCSFVDRCPYGNEGGKVKCMDKKTRIICKTDGLVDKAGLLEL